MSNTSTAITRYIEAPLSERHEYAQALAAAGDLIPRALFGPPTNGNPPQPSPGKVLLVIETGAMLGIHPIAALSSINVIEGKPAASAALMSAVLRGAGHKLRISEAGSIEGGDYSATATLVRSDDPDNPFTSTWTPQRAARAGLCSYAPNDKGIWEVKARSGQGKPLPWESYTESLCKARIVSEVGRDGGQDALLGIRYTPEELGGVVDGNGEWTGDVIDGELVEDAPAPSALPAQRKRATNGTQGTKRPPAKAEAPEAESEPPAVAEEVKPAEVIEDAVIVADEIDPDPASINRDDEAAVKAWNDAYGKDAGYITSTAESARAEAGASAAASAEAAESDDARKARIAANVEAAKAEGAKVRAKREAEEAAAAEAEEREQRAADAAAQEEAARQAELTSQQAAEATQADLKTGEVPEETPAEMDARIKAQRAKDAEAAFAEVGEPWAEGDAHPFDVLSEAEPQSWLPRLELATTVDQVKRVWDEASNVDGAMTTEVRMAVVKHKARVMAQ